MCNYSKELFHIFIVKLKVLHRWVLVDNTQYVTAFIRNHDFHEDRIQIFWTAYTRFWSLATIINFCRVIFCGRASWTLNPWYDDCCVLNYNFIFLFLINDILCYFILGDKKVYSCKYLSCKIPSFTYQFLSPYLQVNIINKIAAMDKVLKGL